MMMSPAMSPNYAAQKFSLSFTDIQLIILVVGLFEFLLFHFLSARKRIHTLLSAFHPSIQPQPSVPDDRGIVQQKRSQPSVSGGDVDVVLRSLGMFVNGGGAKLPASLGAEDLFEMFEDENPSLEEVKEAFNVFDEDRDGFIDAEELQNVLCSLGLKEGLKIDNCRRMIASVDEDGDGRIDFDEFVRFMERNLC